VARPVILRWRPSIDQDLQAVSYHLFLCNNATFIGSAPNCVLNVPIAPVTAAARGITYAGMGSLGIVLGLLGLLFGGVVKGGKGRMLLVLVIVMMMGVFVYSCGGDDGGAPAPVEVTHQVDGLAANVTYFWKVEADDGAGGVSSTAVMSFTTQ
jgi:hypothetical protein